MTMQQITHYSDRCVRLARRALARNDYDLHTVFMQEYASLWQCLADKWRLTR